MAKVDAWMAQREEIARDLRAAADSIMGSEGPMPWLRGKVEAASQARSEVVSAAKRARRTMSVAARKAIGDAQRARWAAQKAAAAAPAKAAKKAKKSA